MPCGLSTYMYDSEEGTGPPSRVALSHSVHRHHACDNRLHLHRPEVLRLEPKQASQSASKISAHAGVKQCHILLLPLSHSWSHTSYPFTPLTFSLASGRPRETSTWAPCSHTSSQSSFGPAEPVRTTWSRPHGPPCRSQFVGSQGLRCLLAVPLLALAVEDPRTQTFSPTPHPRRHPESTNDQRASDRVTRSASSHGEEPGF